jgi:hypothetical protein
VKLEVLRHRFLNLTLDIDEFLLWEIELFYCDLRSFELVHQAALLWQDKGNWSAFYYSSSTNKVSDGARGIVMDDPIDRRYLK